jgi:hypothetical protein
MDTWRFKPADTAGPHLRAFATSRAGFVVEGVPVDGDEADVEAVAVGIVNAIGTYRPPLVHVRDVGAAPRAGTTRSYQHREALGFHADPYDMVGLLCVRPAATGGLSEVVNAVAVHDALTAERPDLAAVLYEPWWFDRRTGDGPDSFYQQPVYSLDSGRLRVNYGPDYMRSALRGPQVPPLTAVQEEALTALDRFHRDPRFVVTMRLRAGDFQFLDNRVMLHRRTAFDDPARHLIRIWLDLS